jgi:hypothetical protein
MCRWGKIFKYERGYIHWNVIFTRLVQDWEVDVFFSFLEMYSFRVIQGDVGVLIKGAGLK